MNYIHDDKLMTAEQRILWRKVRTLFNVDLNDTITPLFYEGPTAASEFIAYVATKLYVAFEVSFYSNGVNTVGAHLIQYHNEADTLNIYNSGSQSAVWNATTAAVNYIPTAHKEQNLYFSRVTVTNYIYMKFIGYRINKVA